MKILIDADGCPVVDETVAIAREYRVQCMILCDTAHEISRNGAQTVIVSKGADSVDFRLVNLVETGDVVVTQDYGLAAMCLAKKAVPIRQDGMVYDESNISGLLLARHTARKIRQGGGRLKGPPKRTKKEDEAYIENLIAVMQASAAHREGKDSG